MAGADSPKINLSRPSTSGAITPSNDLKSTPSTSCACVVPGDEEEVPPVPTQTPMLDPESSTKIVVPTPIPAGSSTLDILPRQPSPMVRAEEQELKDAYLAGFKNVEDFFAKFLESLNFYKRKSAALESEVAALKDSKAALEERIKVLEEERDESDKARAEREKLKEGKAINKMRKLIWSASVSHKRRTEGSNPPVVATVETK